MKHSGSEWGSLPSQSTWSTYLSTRPTNIKISPNNWSPRTWFDYPRKSSAKTSPLTVYLFAARAQSTIQVQLVCCHCDPQSRRLTSTTSTTCQKALQQPQALPHLALVSIITHSIPPSRHPQLLCDLRRPWFPLKLLAVIFRYIIISSSRTSWHPTEWLLPFPFRSRPVNVFWPTYDAMAQQRQI